MEYNIGRVSRSGIGWNNNCDNIHIHRIRGHVYALNITQSAYTGRKKVRNNILEFAIIGK